MPTTPWSNTDQDLAEDFIRHLPYTLQTWAILCLLQTIQQLQDRLHIYSYEGPTMPAPVTKRTRMVSTPSASHSQAAPLPSPASSYGLSELGSLLDLHCRTSATTEAATMTLKLPGVEVMNQSLPPHSFRPVLPPPAAAVVPFLSRPMPVNGICPPNPQGTTAATLTPTPDVPDLPWGRWGPFHFLHVTLW